MWLNTYTYKQKQIYIAIKLKIYIFFLDKTPNTYIYFIIAKFLYLFLY